MNPRAKSSLGKLVGYGISLFSSKSKASSNQENPHEHETAGFSFSAKYEISNYRIFCLAKLGNNPEKLRFSWLLKLKASPL
jgi:hypothetical protein